MRDDWLRGELGLMEPRRNLDELLGVLARAVDEEVDPVRLLDAVAERDPVAAAELVMGPRSVRHPAVVRAALGFVELLESVVPPATLYPRLADAAPSLLAEVTQTAVGRHPRAPWLLALATRERPAGRSWLRASGGAVEVCEACIAAAEAGRVSFREALLVAVREDGAMHALAALARTAGGDVGRLDQLVLAAAAALDRDPQLPLLPWLAAARGPDPMPLARRIHSAVARPEARRALELMGVPSAEPAPTE